MVIPDNPLALRQALEGLVRVNAAMLLGAWAAGRPVPPLYMGGTRYKREPMGREWWQTVADNVAEREADCEDLATHLAAQYRVAPVLLFPELLQAFGVQPIISGVLYPARAVTKRTGPRTYHAIVEHPDGRIEDPSSALGMKVPRRRP